MPPDADNVVIAFDCTVTRSEEVRVNPDTGTAETVLNWRIQNGVLTLEEQFCARVSASAPRQLDLLEPCPGL